MRSRLLATLLPLVLTLIATSASALESPSYLVAGSEAELGSVAHAVVYTRAAEVASVTASVVLPDGSMLYTVGWEISGQSDGTVRRWQLLFGVPPMIAPGPGLITVTVGHADGTIERLERRLDIVGRVFPSERIALNPANTALRATPDPRRDEESRVLWEVLQQRDASAVFDVGNFDLPIESTRVTSDFGKRRVFAYSDGTEARSIHYGVDFGAPTGTPVYAPARGRVVMSRDRLLTGLTIVLEHLPGVFSLYYHLSELDAAEGAVVDRGEMIGRVGSTGLSTGPHLHWEVRVASAAVDPLARTEVPFLDMTPALMPWYWSP